VDRRADIWAFGVVLFEMLTGKRLFEGEDLTDTLASVVKDAPSLAPRRIWPEQAKGKRVDKRADFWSWGVLLYELLTGERLFEGEDAAGSTYRDASITNCGWRGYPTHPRLELGSNPLNVVGLVLAPRSRSNTSDTYEMSWRSNGLNAGMTI
jgi:serine/threonine protein kinase